MFDTEEQFEEGYRQLEGDLETLFKLVFTHRKPVAEADVRIASVILRKWLVEGLLPRLCKSRRLKPAFPALDNAAMLSALAGHPSINYFLTGGIRFDGQPVQGVYNSSLRSAGAPLLGAKGMSSKMFRLGDFLRQKRVYFEGTFFSCEDIIKYTANKLGGAHYDLQRTQHFAKLDEAAAFMKFGGPILLSDKPPSHIYMVLEPEGSEILSAIHIEIIAAATSFIQVQLSGNPVMKLTTANSLVTRLPKVLDNAKPSFKIYDYGSQD